MTNCEYMREMMSVLTSPADNGVLDFMRVKGHIPFKRSKTVNGTRMHFCAVCGRGVMSHPDIGVFGSALEEYCDMAFHDNTTLDGYRKFIV